jgi:SAM-dependent methyltransferase
MLEREVSAYFDALVPEYPNERFDFAVEFINAHKTSESSLLDIWCGSGNVLNYIKNKTGLINISGIEISQNYIQKARSRLQCEIYSGSVLDKDIISKFNKQYDFTILGAVLHHLIGDTWHQSRENAELAVKNALRLTKRHGHLIILEPIYFPALSMLILFYVKRFITRFISDERIHILGTGESNIGAPVVAFFTKRELQNLVNRQHATIVASQFIEKPMARRILKTVIWRQESTTLIVTPPHVEIADIR